MSGREPRTGVPAGRGFFAWWRAAARLAARRPALTDVLAVSTSLLALLLLAQGLLAGFFPETLVHPGWRTEELIRLFPWVRHAFRLGGVLLLVLGLTGLGASAGLAFRRRAGAYLVFPFLAALAGAAVFLVSWGAESGSALAVVLGSVDAAGCAGLVALLGLCWYTIDPLGLHWSREGRLGKTVPSARGEDFLPRGPGERARTESGREV